ncbi:MAG TPA: ATP-binding protein, partial [Phototrophicaceae bacterium]|nr:ATP-binding protein [Phototrophicaceae bacterium]
MIQATGAALSASLILLWVYYRLYRLEPQPSLRIWTYAWSIWPLHYLVVLWQQLAPGLLLPQLLEPLLALTLGLLLLWGTYTFMQRRLPRIWVWFSALVAIWLLVTSFAAFPFALTNLPVYAFLGLTKIFTGVVILRSTTFQDSGRRVIGGAFILLGLHQLDYPFLRPVVWFAPWGYSLAAVLDVVIAVGILLGYFEKVHRELHQSQQHIMLDIAERKRAEAAEYQQRVLAEALRNTASVLTGALDLQEVLSRILEHVAQFVPHDAATVMMIDAGLTRMVAHRGYVERGGLEVLDKAQFSITGHRLYAQMIATGQPLIVNETLDTELWVSFSPTDWVHAYLGAPIRFAGETLGFINLDSEIPNVFKPHDAETLQIFADQAGIALHNAHLDEAVRSQAAELERRVTERTAELARERAQLHAILDAMDEGVIGIIYGDEPETIAYRYANSALHRLTGYDKDEWEPKSIFLGSVPIEDFNAFWIKVNREVMQKGIWKTETTIWRKDQTLIDASLTVTRVVGKDGRAEGVVSIIRDISQQKALEAQKANFVAYASHELRTPLTNLQTRLYLARKQPDKMEEHLRILDEVAHRMRNLVENLLDMSRFERGVIQLKLQAVTVQTFIAGIMEMQQAEADQQQLTLTCVVPPPPVVAQFDPDRLHQVVTNLITNALHHTPSGGSVTVRVLPVVSDTLTIQVEDTGVGIPPEHLPHIFEPFYRVQSSGSGMGLGLSISQGIVRLHQGELTVTSEPGQGSCFT